MPIVLVADNDLAVSGLLCAMLARAGLTVRQAFDGEQARRQVRDPDVRVLVCDLDMPKLSGTEVLESMADLEAPPAAIVVSGFVDEATQERLAALPYVRLVLRKPFDLLAFVASVRQLAGLGADDVAGPGPVEKANGPS